MIFKNTGWEIRNFLNVLLNEARCNQMVQIDIGRAILMLTQYNLQGESSTKSPATVTTNRDAPTLARSSTKDVSNEEYCD